jgi:hypothetical protein
MNRTAQIVALDLMIQQLKAEQRVEDWIKANPTASVWSTATASGVICTVVNDGRTVAHCKGDDEQEARAQAFSAVFTSESAAE